MSKEEYEKTLIDLKIQITKLKYECEDNEIRNLILNQQNELINRKVKFFYYAS